MKEYYIERRTMTKWRIDGDTIEPIGNWLINRDPNEVLIQGYFTGPYVEKDMTQ